MSKRAPKKYGDRVPNEHEFSDGGASFIVNMRSYQHWRESGEWVSGLGTRRTPSRGAVGAH